jgi:hypothetical protein
MDRIRIKCGGTKKGKAAAQGELGPQFKECINRPSGTQDI